jgi:G3E family GTPase
MVESSELVPVVTLTGFLGSGKSTLLNALLGHERMPPTAVIVNELGEIPIDHALIESVTEGVALLRSGCVCCAVRSDLEYTLRDLYLRRVRGILPDFRTVLLETTGVADPGPILQTLSSRPIREQRYSVGTVVTVVDCSNIGLSLARYAEAARQIAVADRLILTKSDLCTEQAIAAVAEHLQSLNPVAACVRVVKGRAAPEQVLGKQVTHEAALPAVSPWSDTIPRMRGPHSGNVNACCYSIPHALDWEDLRTGLQALLDAHGDQVLRIKAILQISGIEQPVVLHGVHHSLYPPELLSSWSRAGRGGRLVVIVDGLEQAIVDEAVRSLTEPQPR